MRGVLAVLLLGCGSDPPTPTPTWHSIATGETSALLAVWGASSDEVWVVGGRTSLSGGPTILRYDGATWTRVDSQQTNLDLWWVFGFADGDVFMTGSGGSILRYRDGGFTRLNTPSVAGTIFGLWGSSPTDLWAVGDAGTAGGVVWHSVDGQNFEPVTIPGTAPRTVFKVHGQASNDVWMSCSAGLTLHWDGTQLVREQASTTNSLFSMITTPGLAVTVGGISGVGELFENTGNGWASPALQVPVPWRGTAAIGSDITIVGESGVVAQRTTSTWTVLKQQLTTLNFHSAWIDEDHGLWAVGGLFDGGLSDGVLVYYGSGSIAEVSP